MRPRRSRVRSFASWRRRSFQDFESDREFTGNPFLTDSELFNAEARYEWYFARNQRLSLAGFYKKIDNPIEAAAVLRGRRPAAHRFRQRAGGHALRRRDRGAGSRTLFGTKRLLLIGNYTYTQSELKVDDSEVVGPDLQPIAANLLFRDGAPLTGQSDHLANFRSASKTPSASARQRCWSATPASASPIVGPSRASRGSPTSSRSRASGSTSCCARSSISSAPCSR
jgi:outer membrane receptor protein involved in Fe transport